MPWLWIVSVSVNLKVFSCFLHPSDFCSASLLFNLNQFKCLIMMFNIIIGQFIEAKIQKRTLYLMVKSEFKLYVKSSGRNRWPYNWQIDTNGQRMLQNNRGENISFAILPQLANLFLSRRSIPNKHSPCKWPLFFRCSSSRARSHCSCCDPNTLWDVEPNT